MLCVCAQCVRKQTDRNGFDYAYKLVYTIKVDQQTASGPYDTPTHREKDGNDVKFEWGASSPVAAIKTPHCRPRAPLGLKLARNPTTKNARNEGKLSIFMVCQAFEGRAVVLTFGLFMSTGVECIYFSHTGSDRSDGLDDDDGNACAVAQVHAISVSSRLQRMRECHSVPHISLSRQGLSGGEQPSCYPEWWLWAANWKQQPTQFMAVIWFSV